MEQLHQANEKLQKLDDRLEIVYKELKEKYSVRFPELDTLNILNPLEYAKCILEIGNENDLNKVNLTRVISQSIQIIIFTSATVTSGRPFREGEYSSIEILARTMIEICNQREEILKFIEEKMTEISPNLTSIVGTRISSLLVASAGGIEGLVRIPAGYLQSIGLGGKKASLQGFSRITNKPTSYLEESDLVLNTPKEYKRQALRLVSSKVALAIRIDAATHSRNGSKGMELRQEIVRKLEKLVEPALRRPTKLIPPPPLKAIKKRGGKRARREKQIYAQTEMRKLQNRVEFGRPEEELVVSGTVKGMGMLKGVTSGLERMPQVDTKVRELVKKHSQKAYSKSGIMRLEG